MSTFLPPIGGPVSLEKMAYDAIKEAILTFQLKPGEALVENELAKQLQISKTPVRNALMWLEKEGLVVRAPYRGASVADLTLEEMEEIFEIRSVLEGLATRLATPLFTEEEIEEAQLILRKHARAADQGRMDDASKHNREFHNLIVQKAPNHWLKQTLNHFEDHMRRYRVLSNFQSGRLNKSVKEHERILDALIDRNADEADKAMEAHLISVKRDLESNDFDQLLKEISHQ